MYPVAQSCKDVGATNIRMQARGYRNVLWHCIGGVTARMTYELLLRRKSSLRDVGGKYLYEVQGFHELVF